MSVRATLEDADLTSDVAREFIYALRAEVERLARKSDAWMESHDEQVAKVERLTADLAAARAQRDGLAKAVAAADAMRYGIRKAGAKREPELYGPVMAYDAARAALPTPPEQEAT